MSYFIPCEPILLFFIFISISEVFLVIIYFNKSKWYPPYLLSLKSNFNRVLF
jgi:hypothetical protein